MFVNFLDMDGSLKCLVFVVVEKLGVFLVWMIMYLGNDGFFF